MRPPSPRRERSSGTRQLISHFSVDRSHLLRNEGNAIANADSHIANRDMEYVVFDTYQILPGMSARTGAQLRVWQRMRD